MRGRGRQVGNLAYMCRLGLWGPGSAFKDFEVGPASALYHRTCVDTGRWVHSMIAWKQSTEVLPLGEDDTLLCCMLGERIASTDTCASQLCGRAAA